MKPSEWKKSRLTAILGTEFPIVQGAMGGLKTQNLAATVSNFGGLGSFGAHGLIPGEIHKVIAEIRERTSRPFAINLWVSMEDEGAFTSGKEAFARALSPIAPLIRELGGPMPSPQPYIPIQFEDQARAILDARVPVFSFIFGIPPKEILEECRRLKIVTIGGATTPEEAQALEQAGVDAVVASGFEGGGHRGSFLRPSEESLFGTFSLVPQIADLVSIPVIAAGGIADARGALAALILGAEGVQIGTAFLGSQDCGAPLAYREAILEGKTTQTALTEGFTGRLARGIRNRLMEVLDDPKGEILPYPLQRGLVKNLTAIAERAGRDDLMQLWAGQSAPLSRYADSQEFLQNLVTEIATLIQKW